MEEEIIENIDTKSKARILRTEYRVLLQNIFISMGTSLFTFAIIALVIWRYHVPLFEKIANSYVQAPQVVQEEKTIFPVISDVPTPTAPVVVKKEDTVVTAVAKARPAVVSIILTKEIENYSIVYKDGVASSVPSGTTKKQVGSGSGFLISSDGYIVTNKHVVPYDDVVYTVQLNSGKKYTAQVLARDNVLDVALIKINVTKAPYLLLGQSSSLEIGETVIAIGNALGEFKNTVSSGVVSGLGRSVVASNNSGGSEKLSDVIQTDAAINPGNSGGPLLNIHGEVVGINVAVATGSSNIGFALPIDIVKSVISEVKKTGKISRPYVGVRYTPVTEKVKNTFGLSVDYGLLVQKSETQPAVVPGSPAEKAGIVDGDILLSIDSRKLDADLDFINYIRQKNIGDAITLKVLSNGIEKTLKLKLEKVPEEI